MVSAGKAQAKEPFVPDLEQRQKLFLYLAAIFVSSLLLGDLIGGKAFVVTLELGGLRHEQPISVGLFAFPITFLLTDVVNEFYGRRGARFLTFLGMWMAIFAFVILNLAMLPAAEPQSYFLDGEFNKIFGIGGRLFVASVLAYLCGQFLDIYVFQFWKALTQSRHLWLRATGSTLASQIVDTLLINLLFWWAIPLLSGDTARPLDWVGRKAVGEYFIKFFIALSLTPVVYALHNLITHRMKIAPEPALKQAA
jgi:queuosine precursor transporter